MATPAIARISAAGRRVLAVLVALMVGRAAPIAAQSTPPAPTGRSVLVGYVRDELGHPISLASVVVEGTKLSTISDDSGYFRLKDAPSGPETFTIMRIGYAPVSFEITMPPDSAVNTEIHLRAVVNVAKMTVTDKATPAGLTKVGFTERQRLGFGYFVTPDMIEKAPLTETPAAMLRQTPGLVVTCPRRVGGGCSVAASGGCLSLWVDGARDPAGVYDLDDIVARSALYAIEAYPHAMQVPQRFQANSGGNACGAIVVWTTLKAR